jgi:hypothetical protein
MRNRPTIRLYSDDAPRHCGSSKLGIIVGLGLPLLFGASVYAATERFGSSLGHPIFLLVNLVHVSK